MSNYINELGQQKVFANRGLPRNNKPLCNIIYRVEIRPVKDEDDLEKYGKYMFKDQGIMGLLWAYDKKDNLGQLSWNMHGGITVDDFKEQFGQNQYSKLCQGKREFILQRRIDGKNIQVRK